MPEHDHECSQFLEQISDYIDGTLDENSCEHFQEHLDECEHCRIVIDTTRKTIELYYKSNEEIQIPDDVRSRLFHCLDLDEFSEQRQSVS